MNFVSIIGVALISASIGLSGINYVMGDTYLVGREWILGIAGGICFILSYIGSKIKLKEGENGHKEI